MIDLIWRGIARIVSAPAVADWLIQRAQRTPYTDIHRPDGSLYMGRWWLFNPYPSRWSWLPSARIHHIMLADSDDHLHDHPWNARTIVLRNGYVEERPTSQWDNSRMVYWRARGYTGRLLFGQYHRISLVPPEGAWTLFITWEKQGTWGFLVDGVKVPWRKYLGLEGQP